MIYVIDFDPIRDYTCLALQNDHQILKFVKDNYAVGKKRPEMLAKVPNAKVVLFISNQSLDNKTNKGKRMFYNPLNCQPPKQVLLQNKNM